MSVTETAESPPAKRSRRAAATVSKAVDKDELAARLFVKFCESPGGRTPEHYARVAIEAAGTFFEVLEAIANKE